MALELGLLPVAQMSYKKAYATWRALGIFRRVREELRALGAGEACLRALQYSAAAQQAGWETETLEHLVVPWLYQRPLKYLRFCRRHGLEAFFTFLRCHEVQIGVFSDYPVAEKLRSLGIAQHVALSLCATDAEINAFKPHPKGFLQACQHWGLPPETVLYIGDRPAVDATGALQAGMPCAIIASWLPDRERKFLSDRCQAFPSFPHLQRALTS